MSEDPHVRSRTDPTAFERRSRGDGRASVAVLGGGVAGLTAAQELARRRFDVTVYEATERFGGKVRSVPGPDRGEQPPLPAGNGFCRFPGFYRHVTDTMERIPDGDRTVADNLVAAPGVFAEDGPDSPSPGTGTPRSVSDWRDLLESTFGSEDIPADEVAYFVQRLLYVLTACRERRADDLESRSWWEFVNAEEMSPAYRRRLARGPASSLVGVRPEVASARSVGQVYVQLLQERFDPSTAPTRLLNAPASEAWIDPWVSHLDRLGVDLRPETPVTGIHADGRQVTGVEAGGESTSADYYVAALPLEPLRELRTRELDRTVPGLGDLDGLQTALVAGVQFYLAEDVRPPQGVYHDSPWGLTVVSPAQFWDRSLAAYGAGDAEGLVSVVVSEWDEPGTNGKPARECSPEAIREEVLAQLGTRLDDVEVVDWALDPSLTVENGTVSGGNGLLVDTVGSLQHRPETRTDAENFLLAADYVRTNTGVASVESANEAARRAVNAVLESEGIRSEDCEVWDLDEPVVFEPLKGQDRLNYRLGLPHAGEAGDSLWDAYSSLRPSGLFD